MGGPEDYFALARGRIVTMGRHPRTKKNSRSRLALLPAPGYIDAPDLPRASGMTVRREIINVQSAVPTYDIDILIPELVRKGVQFRKTNDLILDARSAVDIAGARAIDMARAELLQAPQARAVTSKLARELAKLQQQIGRVCSNNSNLVAFDAADEANVIDDEPDELRRPKEAFFFALREVEEIYEDLAAVRVKIDAFMGRLKQRPKPRHSPNADPLATHWMEMAAWAWHSLTNEWPNKSNRRHFVHFLAAGWQDLGFPTEDAKGSPRVLETWFSERLSKRNLLAEDL